MSTENNKACELSFDLSKQFISIAFAGIAFAIGISTANDSVASTWLFWISVVVFTLSAILGFLFMMRGVADFAGKQSFDIFERGTRLMSIFQIVLVFIGVIFLLFLHLHTKNPSTKTIGNGIRIEFSGNTIFAPSDASFNLKINADGSLDMSNQAQSGSRG